MADRNRVTPYTQVPESGSALTYGDVNPKVYCKEHCPRGHLVDAKGERLPARPAEVRR